MVTPRFRSRRSAGIYVGNREGNDGNHQSTQAVLNSRLPSRISPKLGIRYT